MEIIRLALDWTPNTNHTGFFCALEKGFYADAKLEVMIRNPANDDYRITPAKKVEQGAADFALCPMESVISYRTKATPFDLTAVAGLLRADLSAIACLADSAIHSPADLDGKVYASYQARYEDGIVRKMIQNDGGEGNLEIIYPRKLGIWSTLLTGKADATWIFSNWEGLQAKAEGVDLRQFRMKDYRIPYSYSPVLAAGASAIASRRPAYEAFLAATRRGFLYAAEHPSKAAQLLEPYVPAQDHSIDLEESQRFTAPYYGEEATWGRLEATNIERFLTWLRENDLEQVNLQSEGLLADLRF